MRIAGIVGSLRAGSSSAVVMDTLADLAPEGMTVERVDIGAVPHFNEDLKADGSPPEVLELTRAVHEADGLLIVTPEYNKSFPGVLKNALDWISNEPGWAMRGTPTAVVTQSHGARGGALANYHLRQVLSALGASLLTGPEAAVADSKKKTEDGRIVDEATRDRLADEMAALAEAIRRARA